MENRNDLIAYIWEAYKELYGVRPRYIDFDEMSDDELITMYDRLLARLVEIEEGLR